MQITSKDIPLILSYKYLSSFHLLMCPLNKSHFILIILGYWSVWCTAKMFEAARIMAMYNGFIDFQKIDGREAGIVIVKQGLKLKANLHQKSLNSRFDILINTQLLQVGKTSLVFNMEFIDGTTKEVFGENIIKSVRMNRKTRRPMAFPDWFYEKYKSYTESTVPNVLTKQPLPEIPKNAFQFVVVPRHSDTDRNNHVNQSSYIKFCMDVATHASLSGYYAYYTQDMCLYAPLHWTISYVGECVANDNLHVYTWQDDDSAPSHIQFSILLKDRVIFHASTIFDSEPKKRRLPAKY